MILENFSFLLHRTFIKINPPHHCMSNPHLLSVIGSGVPSAQRDLDKARLVRAEDASSGPLER